MNRDRSAVQGAGSPLRVSRALSTYAHIYAVVSLIPRGRVATYGQIAALAGIPRRARQVGYALAALTDGDDVPWQRVVNARGEISKRSRGESDRYQRVLLESEGIEFDSNGRIALSRFLWLPGSAAGAPGQ